MRLVFLDEAGISNQKHEPTVVVAGVVVHADGQLRAVDDRLTELADQYAPASARDGFIFHAKDIFSGGEPFNRDAYPDPAQRSKILQALCEFPHELSLPVVFGWVNKVELLNSYPNPGPHDLTVAAQGIASCLCTLAVERHMRTLPNDEVAMLIYEDNDNCKKLVTDMQRRFRSNEFAPTKEASTEWEQALPLRHIMGQPAFSSKRGSSVLQIADACAFALKRRMMGREDSRRFMTKLELQLTTKPKVWPAFSPRSESARSV